MHAPPNPPPTLPLLLQQLEVGLPDVMMQGVEQYTQYFDETTSKTRRLSWQVRWRPGKGACCRPFRPLAAPSNATLLPECGMASFSVDCRAHARRWFFLRPHASDTTTAHPFPHPP
jgi:hypothetical protein